MLFSTMIYQRPCIPMPHQPPLSSTVDGVSRCLPPYLRAIERPKWKTLAIHRWILHPVDPTGSSYDVRNPSFRQQYQTVRASAESGDRLPLVGPQSSQGRRDYTTQDGSLVENKNFARTVVPTALALMLCNMDRICLSVAMVPIAAELGWGEGVQGIVQSAFLWGYLANQIIGGTLADIYGGKSVMAWGILFFSMASALLPSVAVTPTVAALGATLPAVLLVRFLVGLGEGVALPSMNNLIATRIRPSLRATALGMVFSGFQSGNLAGLLLSPLIVQSMGWRALFYVYAVLGMPLLLLWYFIIPEDPRKKEMDDDASASRAMTSQELSAGADGYEKNSSAAEIARRMEDQDDVSLTRLLKSSAVWAIIVANFANHWGYFMYLNWMPTYFFKAHAMDLRASSFMSFLPWLVMAIGSSLSGLFSDALVHRGFDRTEVRKLVQTLAFMGPVIPLLLLARGGLTPTGAVVAMTLALGLTSVGQFVTNMSDIAPNHAGKIFGLCNTFGCVAGIVSVASELSRDASVNGEARGHLCVCFLFKFCSFVCMRVSNLLY